MSITWDEILVRVANRQSQDAPLLTAMIEVKQRYNGEWVLPDPTNDSDQIPSTTPQLIAESIDFLGMQAASVMPYMNTPAVDPTRDKGVRSREWADKRRKVLGATHHKSRTKLHLRRAFRQLAGYATTSMIIVPDLQRTYMPMLQMRDPLTTYPEPRSAEDLCAPTNCAYVTIKSVDWIRKAYPQTRHLFQPVRGREFTGTELWEMIEWVDEDCTVVGVGGPHQLETRIIAQNGGHVPSMELFRWENPTGVAPCYIPARVTLDKIVSAIGNLTGQVDLMDRLQALAIAAGEKAIFPDRYIIGDSVRAPSLVGGEWKDGRTGDVNLVLDAKSIGELRGTPDPSTTQMIDRIERNTRVSSGLVPQAGGESYGALRTGRGIDSLMGASVDPRVQEMHEVMEVALEHLNTVILEQYKAYWPDKEYRITSGWQGDRGTVEFTPSVHIELTDNVVAYTIPGADVQSTTIQLGQLYGMKAISLQTLRMRHPWIDDAAAEGQNVEEELLEQAILEGLATQVSQGQVPVTYLALVEKHRKSEGDIIQAVLKADAEMSEQQAALAAQPQDQPPGPEAMPGLAPPGLPPGPMPGGPPAEAPMVPGEIGATDNQRSLRRLMEALSQAPPVTG